jgi:tRNA A-37 threonylcarbamoyl transferase component Bud32
MPNWAIEKPMPLELVVSDKLPSASPDERQDSADPASQRAARCWVNPEWAWLVEAYSLDRSSGIERVAGISIADEPARLVSQRCELATGPTQSQSIRVRVERRPSWRERGHDFIHGKISSTAIRHEYQISQRLLRAGFGVAPPLVYTPPGRRAAPGWLVMIEPSEATCLAEHLAEIESQHPLDRLQWMIELGREIARWHAAGFVHGQLAVEHVLFVPGRPARFVFTELGRATHQLKVTSSQRADELASLLTSVSPPLATRAERNVLLDSYLGAARLGLVEGDFRRQVSQSREFRSKQLERQQATQQDWRAISPIAPFESSENCQMWCDVRDQAALRSAALGSLDQVMGTQSGRLLRTLVNRENWRIELRGSRGAYGAYLKKHRIVDWKMRLRARLGLAPSISEGRIEAENVARLEREGIPTMRLIAFGERSHADGLQESFVLTEELAGFVQLDHFLLTRFAVRDPARGRIDRDLGKLIREVARVARMFHRWGHNHRDFYLCHFFVREPRPGKFEVKLIDLQRVQSRRWNKRWGVLKDLTQLAYSAHADRFGCREKLLFLHHYLDVRKLQPQHKRLVRRILAKQRWKEWRLGPHV